MNGQNILIFANVIWTLTNVTNTSNPDNHAKFYTTILNVHTTTSMYWQKNKEKEKEKQKKKRKENPNNHAKQIT